MPPFQHRIHPKMERIPRSELVAWQIANLKHNIKIKPAQPKRHKRLLIRFRPHLQQRRGNRATWRDAQPRRDPTVSTHTMVNHRQTTALTTKFLLNWHSTAPFTRGGQFSAKKHTLRHILGGNWRWTPAARPHKDNHDTTMTVTSDGNADEC